MSNDGVEIIPATLEHARHIAERARVDDINELFAIACVTPYEAMAKGIEHGEAWTAMGGGEPVVMWGVVRASYVPDAGTPWMVASTKIEQLGLLFLTRCKPYVVAMKDQYDELSNYVDVRNRKTIAWLRWLGFTFEEPVNIGPFAMPFHRFSMR